MSGNWPQTSDRKKNFTLYSDTFPETQEILGLLVIKPDVRLSIRFLQLATWEFVAMSEIVLNILSRYQDITFFLVDCLFGLGGVILVIIIIWFSPILLSYMITFSVQSWRYKSIKMYKMCSLTILLVFWNVTKR